jgi:dUTPase
MFLSVAMIPTPYYRLELCPTLNGQPYYQNSVQVNNENAGVDLYVSHDYDYKAMMESNSPTLLDLGCSARMVRVYSNGSEEEVHYWLCPRSSIFKTGMVMANSQGVIDRSYRGVLKAPVWIINRETCARTFDEIRFRGTRYFQIVAPDMGPIRDVCIVESLNETTRGAGGFGSTGLN